MFPQKTQLGLYVGNFTNTDQQPCSYGASGTIFIVRKTSSFVDYFSLDNIYEEGFIRPLDHFQRGKHLRCRTLCASGPLSTSHRSVRLSPTITLSPTFYRQRNRVQASRHADPGS